MLCRVEDSTEYPTGPCFFQPAAPLSLDVPFEFKVQDKWVPGRQGLCCVRSPGLGPSPCMLVSCSTKPHGSACPAAEGLSGFVSLRPGKEQTPPSSTTCSLLFQVLWIIPQRAVRWVLVMIALGISGSVLAMTFWPAVREDNRRVALATIVTILLLHVLLSVGCLVCCHRTLLVWF